jgi:hypothetical protein
VYAGLVTVERSRRKSKSALPRPVVARGDWEPLIDEDTHHALVTFLSDPSRRRAISYERKHMGTGVYRCGVCGGKMKSSGGRGGVAFYRCRNIDYGEKGHVTRKMAPVDELVTAAVLAVLGRAGVQALLVDAPGVDLDELRTRRAALEVRLDELTQLFTAAEIDARQLSTGSADLRAKITEIDQVLSAAAASSPALELLEGNPDELANRWDAASPDLKGKIVDELMVVTINKAPQGSRFNPESIRITPKR